MGSPMLITSEYVTTPPPLPPPGGVVTQINAKLFTNTNNTNKHESFQQINLLA